MLFLEKKWFKFLISAFIFCLLSVAVFIHHTVQKSTVRSAHIQDLIVEHLMAENEELDTSTAQTISQVIYEESAHYGIDYRLILALMKVESNFQYDAVSSRGARGLLQVKPSLAKYIAKDLGIKWNGHKTIDAPDNNIRIGVKFFSQLMEDFDNPHTALKAYNMGPTKVRELPRHVITRPWGFSQNVMTEYYRNISLLPSI